MDQSTMEEEPLHIINSSPATHQVDPASIFSASSPPDATAAVVPPPAAAPETSAIITVSVPYSAENVQNPTSLITLPQVVPAATANHHEAAEEEERKLHKKRSKNWTRVETLRLIKLRTELEPRFSRGGRKTELWDEIAEGLRKDQFFRDAQQCRDKWEKLMAGFKDVREGLKDPSDNPYYDDLQPLLSGRWSGRDKERDGLKRERDFDVDEVNRDRTWVEEELTTGHREEEDEGLVDRFSSRKRKRCGSTYMPVSDIEAVKALLEAVISRQQKFFKELLDSLDRKEQLREQMRQEREERWRAEERAHRSVFNNAMIVLAHRILGEKAPPMATEVVGSMTGAGAGAGVGVGVVQGTAGVSGVSGSAAAAAAVPKKRSKNWKRGEVLQLIKIRGDMEARFANSARRAALWEEVAEMLARQGIRRDGKQCREKWDKLMAAYKDVIDGKREEGDLSYFAELKAIVGGRLEDSKVQADIIQ